MDTSKLQRADLSYSAAASMLTALEYVLSMLLQEVPDQGTTTATLASRLAGMGGVRALVLVSRAVIAGRGLDQVEPGDLVVCLDDNQGAHFLARGGVYLVESTQTDSNGLLRLNLDGMARAWEAARFRLLWPDDLVERLPGSARDHVPAVVLGLS